MSVIRSLFCLLISPFLVLTSDSAFAQQDPVEADVNLSFHTNDIESECYVWVEENSPYSHLNGDCRLYRNHGEGVNYQEDLIAINPRQNFELGPFPRDNDYSYTWYAVFWTSSPDTESVYCAKLGWDDGSGNFPVIFGHHDNSNFNMELPTESQCRSPDPPPPGGTAFGHLFLGCIRACARWRFTFAASGATQFRVERSSWFTGPWSLHSTTSNSSMVANLASNPLYFRVRGENAGGHGPWTVSYIPGQCDGGIIP